ncbi:MAG: hypothetical protein ACR652_14105, partial [Methylocystis sp.]
MLCRLMTAVALTTALALPSAALANWNRWEGYTGVGRDPMHGHWRHMGGYGWGSHRHEWVQGQEYHPFRQGPYGY